MATGSGKTLAAARSAVERTRGLEKVTVYATYAGLGTGPRSARTPPVFRGGT
ncbi:hypothetical protein [Streptomyces sp. NPDC090056]|uniref:hypothetical protein n=1 Tax=Streptomyces sp. NPDC090056 TaxID=3365934 RepID=UPI003816154A